jgi:hypothetical protein
LSIALTIGNQSLQSSATCKFFPHAAYSVSPAAANRRRSPAANAIRCPSTTNPASHPSATNAGDSMTKKPDEGDPHDMETIMSLLKGLQTSLVGLKQDVSTVKLDNSRLSVINHLQLEQLCDEKNLFKEETPDTDEEPNESSDSSQSSSSRTSSSCSRHS